MADPTSLPQPVTLTPEQALQQAIAHHQAGQLQDAERLYRAVLNAQPKHPDANHNLGVLAVQVGQPSAALDHFKAALDANRNQEQYWLSYVDALMQAGQTGVARQVLAEARQLRLGGKALEALAGRLDALSGGEPTPHEIETLASFFTARRYTELAALAQAMTVRFPQHGAGWKALGVALTQMGRSKEALVPAQKAAALVPNDAEAHSNLGNTLRDLGRLEEAEAHCRRALEINPGYAEAHNNLGNLLKDLGRLKEAETRYRRALEIKPDYAEAHCNLGVVYRDRGRIAEAEACYRRALEISPDFAVAHYNIGNGFKSQGRLVDAEASYRRALQIRPEFAEAHSNLIFAIDLLENYGIDEQQAERRRWYERNGRRHASVIKPHANPPDPERRLRVGFVSADFRRHSAYYAFSPVLLGLDRNAFEVVCYSGVKLEDDATARLRQAALVWRSTIGISDEALAEQVRLDRIDILVDLSGHSAGNRLLMFARKPAPVQVTAWGHATGTGLETIDYLLADPVIVPRAERSLYAEEVIDLPCVICYEPPDYLPEVSPLPALGARPFTFGCINRIEKITGRVIALWGRILAALPEAQLLLKDRTCDDARVRQQLLERLGAAGIAAGRVRILGHSPHPEHLKTYHEVDVGLDPFPQGGGISTAEALWMGVPVVTLHGTTIPGRLTPSILTGLGMPEWIAHGDEEYVRIAVQAARDLPGLARLRAGLRARLAASPLGDVQRYTRAVQTAFRLMWRRWCATDTHTSPEIKR